MKRGTGIIAKPSTGNYGTVSGPACDTITAIGSMAESAYFPRLEIRSLDSPELPRRSGIVRATHWINAISFVGLLVSGIAILLAHPRLYWGETGAVGMPSLIDLPLPFLLTGQSGWGRSLHFLSAWVCVITGGVYILSGLATQHFRKDFLATEAPTYSALQRLTYSMVVFVLFPLIIWTGLAMSPAIASVFPEIVTLLGGQQSARTIHFFLAGSLVLFFLVHIAMVSTTGFTANMRGMITGVAKQTFGKGRA
jgi:thiosulfate reductase cytochrome b subunit